MKFKKIVWMSAFVVMGIRGSGANRLSDLQQTATEEEAFNRLSLAEQQKQLKIYERNNAQAQAQDDKNAQQKTSDAIANNRKGRDEYNNLNSIQKMAAKLIVGQHRGSMDAVYSDMPAKISELRNKYLFGNKKEALAAYQELEARFYLLELVKNKNDQARVDFIDSINTIVQSDAVQKPISSNDSAQTRSFNEELKSSSIKSGIGKYSSVASKAPFIKSFIKFLKKIVGVIVRNGAPDLGVVAGQTNKSVLSKKEQADLVKEEIAASAEVISNLRKQGVDWHAINIQFPTGNDETAKVFLAVLDDMKAQENASRSEADRTAKNQDGKVPGEDDAGDLEEGVNGEQALKDKPVPLVEKAPAPVASQGRFSLEKKPTFMDFGPSSGGRYFDVNEKQQTIRDLVKYIVLERNGKEVYSESDIDIAVRFVDRLYRSTPYNHTVTDFMISNGLKEALSVREISEAKAKADKAAADKAANTIALEKRLAAAKANKTAKEVADAKADKAARAEHGI